MITDKANSKFNKGIKIFINFFDLLFVFFIENKLFQLILRALLTFLDNNKSDSLVISFDLNLIYKSILIIFYLINMIINIILI